jgi:hypothetical protein
MGRQSETACGDGVFAAGGAGTVDTVAISVGASTLGSGGEPWRARAPRSPPGQARLLLVCRLTIPTIQIIAADRLFGSDGRASTLQRRSGHE